MAHRAVSEAVRSFASRMARGLRMPQRLQPPMRRKALIEALEQRFLLSAENPVPPPPPPAQAPAVLEAPLNLTAASTPVQYTIQGNAQQAQANAAAEAEQSGVTATTPAIVQLDPALAKAG